MIEATLLQSVRWDLWLSRSLSSLFITNVSVCLPVSPRSSHTRLLLLFCFYWLMMFVIIYLDVLSHYPCASTGNGSWLISRSVKSIWEIETHTYTCTHPLLSPFCARPKRWSLVPWMWVPTQPAEAQRYAAGGVNDVRALCSLRGAICCVLAAVCHHTSRKTST